MKAFLIARQEPFPYTHDLELLLELFPEAERDRYEDFDLERLSTYSVDARYPGVPMLDWEEARAAINEAKQVVEAVQTALEG